MKKMMKLTGTFLIRHGGQDPRCLFKFVLALSTRENCRLFRFLYDWPSKLISGVVSSDVVTEVDAVDSELADRDAERLVENVA